MATATAAGALALLGAGVAPALAKGPVRRLDIPAGMLTAPSFLALSPNGQVLYVSSSNGADSELLSVPLVDPSTASDVLPAPISQMTGVAASHNGKTLYLATLGSDVDVIGLGTTGLEAGLTSLSPGSKAFESPTGLAVSPSGKSLLITNLTNGTVLTADVAGSSDPDNDTVVGEMASPDGPLASPVGMAFSPSGKRLYIASLGGGLYVASVKGSGPDPKITVQSEHPNLDLHSLGDFDVVASPDGRTLYLSLPGQIVTGGGTSEGHEIIAVNAANYRVINAFAGFDVPAGLAIAGDGQTLYVANAFVNAVDAVSLRTLVRKPTIAGRARVGAVLHAHAVRTTLGTAKVRLSYQWLANGRKVKQATGATLKLGAAEQGKRVSVRVTGAAAGLTTTTLSSAATKPVKR